MSRRAHRRPALAAWSRPVSGLVVALAGLLAGEGAARAESLELRVVTYNVWGIPLITPSRAARIAAIGPALAALEPDLVTLQEVWLDEDAEVLTAALRTAGLGHIRRLRSPIGADSGLLVASRHPILEDDFGPFRAGGLPEIPWHLDWAAQKGVGRVRIRTPLGELDFGATHMQATYDSDDYLFVQLSQVLDAVERLGPAGLGDRRPPLILAGDLNAPFHALPFRLLASALELRSVQAKSGIDAILYRAGEGATLERIAAREALTEAVPLADGSLRPMSDHPAVLADFRVTRRPAAAGGVEPVERLVHETTPLIEAELLRVRTHSLRDRALAALLLLATVGLGRGRGLWTLRAPALVAALWFAYLGFGYGPARTAELERLRQRLPAADARGLRLPIADPPEAAAPPRPSLRAEAPPSAETVDRDRRP